MTAVSNRPLRICHIAYTFYEYDNRVMRYAQTLARRGDRVDVVALRSPGRPWRDVSDGIHFFHIQRRSATEKRPWTIC